IGRNAARCGSSVSKCTEVFRLLRVHRRFLRVIGKTGGLVTKVVELSLQRVCDGGRRRGEIVRRTLIAGLVVQLTPGGTHEEILIRPQRAQRASTERVMRTFDLA